MAGNLYLVSTPIGNKDDITYRALRILNEADIIVCEERKEAIRLLRHYNISKPLEELNEHNEESFTEILLNYLREGKTLALISDAGTPVFSDPGFHLVKRAIEADIRIIPIPGATSVLPALVASGFAIDRFVFQGFLSPKREQRIQMLKTLRAEERPIVLLDTPYRLVALMKDVAEIFGNERRICVAFNISMPTEKFFYGTPVQLYNEFERENLKGEFVLIIEGKKKTTEHDRDAQKERLC